MTYPVTLSERDTLDRVLAGQSLARYGDGEFNLCRNVGIKCQPYEARLSDRLRGILEDAGDVLVGIPNIRSETPKAAFWGKYTNHSDLLSGQTYGSAFVTRPDSAPWIHTPDYWQALESLWVGREVTLVRGSEKSLTARDLVGATVREVITPVVNAWAVYRHILARIGTPALAILCVGPTATVLAVDLAARGVHAIDLGHVGMFLKKYRRGEPMVVTAEDRAA